MNDMILKVKQELLDKIKNLENPRDILKDSRLKSLYGQISKVDPSERASFGKAVNDLKNEIQDIVAQAEESSADEKLGFIDVTAPRDINSPAPQFLSSENGSKHPLMTEIEIIDGIFQRMGFKVEDSREIDDQYHMFESLNFPKNHPARDDYDTFMTNEVDKLGDRFIAPAHTSTMQNRILRKYHDDLIAGGEIAAIVSDRVFRNEDLDARHEHTFYQVEGVYVAKGVNVGNLVATLKEFLQEYYGKKLQVRVNPFYFPFTEPSFEFALSCPFCEGNDPNCKVCSGEGWVELLGCGMIHPNVLGAAGIDANEYTGFAFGCGVDRLVMMKHNIEDVRHFESGKLDFLRQFK